MNWRSKFLIVSLSIFPLLSDAGPPFITDDPNPASYQHIQIIPFANAFQNTLGGYATAPGLEIDYGLLPSFEINTIIGQGIIYSGTKIMPNARGLADMQVGIKYAFVNESANIPQIAFAPIYFVPTGNPRTNIGNGKGWEIIPIWLQKSWGTWTCYGGGGYAINNAITMRNYYFAGIVLQKQITASWLLGGELFSQTSYTRYVGPFTVLNLGSIYNFNAHVQGLISFGHNIFGANTTVGYIGLQWNS